MKRYFVEGKEITEAEAKEIQKNNDKYFNSGNMADLLKFKHGFWYNQSQVKSLYHKHQFFAVRDLLWRPLVTKIFLKC